MSSIFTYSIYNVDTCFTYSAPVCINRINCRTWPWSKSLSWYTKTNTITKWNWFKTLSYELITWTWYHMGDGDIFIIFLYVGINLSSDPV